MFRRIDDFVTAWQYEAGKTLAVLEAVPDGALDKAIAPGHRDLRRLGWHLVESLIEMPGHMGLRNCSAEPIFLLSNIDFYYEFYCLP